jgi:hypothetical protein
LNKKVTLEMWMSQLRMSCGTCLEDAAGVDAADCPPVNGREIATLGCVESTSAKAMRL